MPKHARTLNSPTQKTSDTVAVPNSAGGGVVTEGIAWVGRGLILGLLAVCPWPYAMANWTHQTWLAPIAIVLLAVAGFVAIRKQIQVLNPVIVAMLIVLSIALVQTVPLPEGLWRSLSASADFDASVTKLAAEFGSPDTAQSTGTLQTLSIHPLQTLATSHVLATAICVFLASVVLFRTWASVVALLCVLALTGFCEASLGLYQAIAAGDWRLLDDMRVSSFATFISRNSAPQYFASAMGALLGLLMLYRNVVKRREDKRYQITYPSVNPIARTRRWLEEFVAEADPMLAIGLCGMVVILAGILVANSRGGILACVASGLVVAAVAASGKQSSLTGLVGILLLMFGCIGFLGLFELDAAIGIRLNTINEELRDLDNPRFELWQMALSQRTAWLFGSGLGAFHFAILPAYAAPSASWFYHAENVFIEVLSSTGPIGLLAVLFGVGWLLLRLLRRHESNGLARALRVAALYPVAVVCMQSAVDFSLVLPGVFLPLAALVGAYLAAGQLPGQQRRRTRRSGSSVSRRSKSKTGSAESQMSGERALSGRGEAKVDLDSKSAVASVSVQVLCVAVPVAVAVWAGWQPLNGFAQAERIAAAGRDAVGERDIAVASRYESFPEVALQRGRFQQKRVEEQVFQVVDWPAGTSERMRRSMARPEFFSAAFLDLPPGSELLGLRELIDVDRSWTAELAGSDAMMRPAALACALDWRASWGMLRSNLGQLTTDERNRNYATLMLACRSNLGVAQAAATHAVISGNMQAGLEMWRILLPTSPLARSRIATLLGSYLTIEQLLEIFPDQPLMQIALAQQLDKKKLDVEVELILSKVRLSDAFDEGNTARNWIAIAWAAARRGESGLLINALKEATLDSVKDHKLNYRLAQHLREAGRFLEARTEINHALILKPNEPAYKDFLKELRDE